MFDNVVEFQKVFSLGVAPEPKIPESNDLRQLRKDLLKEEYEEYLEAEENDDLVEIADALADIIYIACGTAAEYGIDLNAVFEEVHRSNMAKAPGGVVLRHPNGKIKKPEDWTPPDIAGVLRRSNITS